jgi:hypothetical protein
MIKSKDKIHKIIIENQAHRNFIEKRAQALTSTDKATDMKIIIKFLSIKVTKVNNFLRKNIQETLKL